MDADELDWNRTLREQWEFHWNHQVRARLNGLTEEYFWSPVPDAWSVRRRGTSTAPVQVGAGDAATALQQLETQLDVWPAGVRELGDAGLRVPVGDAEPYPELPMADLVLNIHRELIHHLSEVSLLRDLYLHARTATNGARR